MRVELRKNRFFGRGGAGKKRWIPIWIAMVWVGMGMGFANQGFAQVRISQAYGGGGNTGASFKNDFIELYNAGANTVSLSGWSIQYASATASTGSYTVTTLSGSIGPKKYFLIQQDAGAGGTQNLPTPDATGTIGMTATGFRLALVSNVTALAVTSSANALGIIDFVGASSSATKYEGTGPAPAPSNTTAILRKDGGETDTDNNSFDFTSTTPNPRNSASSVNPSIATSATSLNQFSATAGTASDPQSFTVLGFGLSTAIAVTSPAGFEISSNGINYSASLSLPAVGGTVSVRIPASATIGSSPSGSITLASSPALSRTVAVSGAVTAANSPAVSCSPTTLTGFSTVAGTASAAQSFTVSGSNLNSDITVTAPSGFEVSTDAASYASSKTLTQVSRTVAATTISVRIAASTAAGPLASANVTVEATGVTTANVAVSGTVTTPALTLTLIPTSVAENAGPNASTGTVGIPASLGTDLIVNLTSANMAAATVPASVTINGGQTSVTFPIAAVANSSSYGTATTAIQASNTNYTTASATLTVTNVDVPPAPLAVKGWINEFHYDNANTDSGEFVEIVLAPGTSTSNVSVVLYNGFDGKPYTTDTPAKSTFPLSQFLAGESSNGYTIYSLAIPGIQNGPDGLVLIIDGVPEDLVSYEGSFAATDGLAAGYTLPDIGIAQTGTEAVGSSLYRYGPGNTGRDFAWAKATVATPGQVNAGQTLGVTGVQGTGTLAIANTTASSPFVTQNIFPKATAGQTVSLTLTGTLSSGTISSMSVVVPAAFTGLSAGNVTASGTGAGTPVTTLSGSTLTITGLVVDQLSPVTINIAGLTTPETAGDLTKDGNYPFTVQTGVEGNTKAMLLPTIAVVTIPIANLGDVDANGVSLDVGKTVAVQGVCTEENFNSTSSTSAFLQSGQPDGILKAGINVYYTKNIPMVRGNTYVAAGVVANYLGVTEIIPTSTAGVVSLGVGSSAPTAVTLTLAELATKQEAYEGSLVRVVGLSKVSGTWAYATSNPGVVVSNNGSTATVLIKQGSTATVEPSYPATVAGIYGQNVTASPYVGGAQIQPRDEADVESAPGIILSMPAGAYVYESNKPTTGGATTKTLTVTRQGTATAEALVVALGVSPQGLLTVPASATIPAGQNSVDVTVTAIDNSTYLSIGYAEATVTANVLAGGFVQGSITVQIIEDEVAPAPDITKPVIALIGANPQLVANGGVYTDLKATVTDNVDASREITGTGTVTTAVAGDYTITYNASDAAGNAAFPVTRTVRVAAPLGSTFAVAYPGKITTDIAPNGLSYLANYGFGGSEGIAPTLPVMDSSDSTKLKLVVVFRTDDSSISLGGQTSTDLALAGSWSTTGVSVDPSTDASPVPANTARKVVSVDRGSGSKRFLRATITR